MISHISVRDFAIIEELELDLAPGLNIMTGETGAGKSVIIEAISMALGARADASYIRTGANKALISLSADAETPEVLAMLEELGAQEGSELLIQREISASGRNLCRVNGQPVPLSALGRICRRIADIHGQYDHQSLLDPENHIAVLDLYGRDELRNVRDMAAGFYADMTRTASRLAALEKSLADAERRKDFMRYELAEIEAAAVMPEEDEELEREIRLMQNSESVYRSLSAVCEAVYEGEDAAVNRLSSALSAMQGIAEYSKDIEEAAGSFSEAYYALDELSRDIRKLRDSVSFSPQELDEKMSRLDAIERLKRKYGGSIEGIFAYREQAERELAEIENAGEETETLKSALKLHTQQYEAAAARLTALRKQAAKLLEEEVGRELSELNFKDAALSVSIAASPPSPSGSDSAEFLMRTNRGEPLKPLAKIASGGELSRIMLAMKRIIGDLDSIPTMIFDEIDSGISGAAAGVVGEKLRSIAREHQVICITHLPQIACQADSHYRIVKTEDEVSVHTGISPLARAGRVEELARLLSGTSVSAAARLQAEELLSKAGH